MWDRLNWVRIMIMKKRDVRSSKNLWEFLFRVFFGEIVYYFFIFIYSYVIIVKGYSVI